MPAVIEVSPPKAISSAGRSLGHEPSPVRFFRASDKTLFSALFAASLRTFPKFSTYCGFPLNPLLAQFMVC